MFSKRPTKDDSDDDLLKFQQDFLSSRDAPAAKVVRLSRNLPEYDTPIAGSAGISDVSKDVINLEGASNYAALDSRAKPSMFKKKKQTQPTDLDSQVDAADPHITNLIGSAAVGDVVERSVDLFPYEHNPTSADNFSAPLSSTTGFPQALQRSQVTGLEKKGTTKKSLFAMDFERRRMAAGAGKNVKGQTEASRSPNQKLSSESGRSQSLLGDKSTRTDRMSDTPMSAVADVSMGVDARPMGEELEEESVGGKDLSAVRMEVDEENKKKMTAMSPEEISEAREELMKQLDPSLVQMLTSKKQPIRGEATGTADIPKKAAGGAKKSVSFEETGTSSEKEASSRDDDSKWKGGQESMETGTLPNIEANLSSDPAAIHASAEGGVGKPVRFDLRGVIVPQTAENESPADGNCCEPGLHHHGDEPAGAGYTLEKLFAMVRSVNSRQKSFALETLTQIVKKCWRGAYAGALSASLLPAILQGGLVFLIRWALDEKAEMVMSSAVFLLHALLCPELDKTSLKRTLLWHGGQEIPYLNVPEPAASSDDDVKAEKDQTDVELVGVSVVRGLLRMDILPRLRYLLEMWRPQAPVVIAILEILTRIALDAADGVTRISKCPRLLDVIFQEFLPFTWETKERDMSMGYQFPLAAAVRLIRYMICASRPLVPRLLDDYNLFSRLARLCVGTPGDLGLLPTEAEEVCCEAIATLRSLVLYRSVGVGIRDFVGVILSKLSLLSGSRSFPQYVSRTNCMLVTLAEAILKAASTGEDDELPDEQSKLRGTTGSRYVSWSQVCHIVEPVRLLFKITLANICGTYHTQIVSLDLCTALMNYLAAYYEELDRQPKYYSEEVCRCLTEEMNDTVLPFMRSFSCKKVLRLLLAYSEILAPSRDAGQEEGPGITVTIDKVPNLPILSSILIPLVSDTVDIEDSGVAGRDSPVGFISALLRLLTAAVKLNKPLGSPVCTVLRENEYVRSYIRQLADASLPRASHSYFLRYEISVAVRLLALITDPSGSADVQSVAEDSSKEIKSDPPVVKGTVTTEIGSVDEKCTEKDDTNVDRKSSTDDTVVCMSQKGLAETARLYHTAACRLLLYTGGLRQAIWVDALLRRVIFSHGLYSNSVSAVTRDLDRLHLSGNAAPNKLDEDRGSDVLSWLLKEGKAALPTITDSYHKELVPAGLSTSRAMDALDCPNIHGQFVPCPYHPAVPTDWPFMILMKYYQISCSPVLGPPDVNFSRHLSLDVTNSLRFILLLETYNPSVLSGIAVTARFSRLLCVFLLDSELFLERQVNQLLVTLLTIYCSERNLSRMDFSKPIPGLSSPLDLYSSLLDQFESVSYGDSTFSLYVLVLQQTAHDVNFRKSLWGDHSTCLRNINIRFNSLPVENFLDPEETDVAMLKHYATALFSGLVTRSRNPLLYLMAVHHLNRFMYTNDGHHKELTLAVLRSSVNCKDKSVGNDLLRYKSFNPAHGGSISLYEPLPARRQALVRQAEQM